MIRRLTLSKYIFEPLVMPSLAGNSRGFSDLDRKLGCHYISYSSLGLTGILSMEKPLFDFLALSNLYTYFRKLSNPELPPLFRRSSKNPILAPKLNIHIQIRYF